MKQFTQLPEVTLPAQLKQFLGTFLSTFLVVLLIHALFLSIYAFITWDMSLVVSGFDMSQWSMWGRLFVLLPYLFLPLTLSICKVAGCSLTSLRNTFKRITKLRSGAAE